MFDWRGKRGSEKSGEGASLMENYSSTLSLFIMIALFFFFFVLSFSRLLCLGFLYKLLVFFLYIFFFLILWVIYTIYIFYLLIFLFYQIKRIFYLSTFPPFNQISREKTKISFIPHFFMLPYFLSLNQIKP